MDDATKVRIYTFLATPAHAWLWVCSKMVGGTFWFGPAEDIIPEDTGPCRTCGVWYQDEDWPGAGQTWDYENKCWMKCEACGNGKAGGS